MTSPNSLNEVLKQDCRGRVWVPRERRNALLAEFERSGVSGAEFARMAGIKYQTFTGWRYKQRKVGPVGPVLGEGEPRALAAGSGPIRLLEAVVSESGGDRVGAAAALGLVVELPGGSRVQVHAPSQLAMAAELVALIAQRSRAC